MSFKLHLIIVSVLIASMLAAWALFAKPPAPPPAPPASPYTITVAHASWGLNCLTSQNLNGGELQTQPQFLNDSGGNRPREDNVLQKVSERCNGRVVCPVPLTTEILGPDPDPACTEKTLQIEYRCFSFDRPWIEKSTTGEVVLNCEKKHKVDAAGK